METLDGKSRGRDGRRVRDRTGAGARVPRAEGMKVVIADVEASALDARAVPSSTASARSPASSPT